MGEKVALTIDVTPDEQARIEALAREYGYDSPGEYLLALVELVAEDIDAENPIDAFRQSWHEAMTGQTYPVSTLWDDMDDE